MHGHTNEMQHGGQSFTVCQTVTHVAFSSKFHGSERPCGSHTACTVWGIASYLAWHSQCTAATRVMLCVDLSLGWSDTWDQDRVLKRLS